MRAKLSGARHICHRCSVTVVVVNVAIVVVIVAIVVVNVVQRHMNFINSFFSGDDEVQCVGVKDGKQQSQGEEQPPDDDDIHILLSQLEGEGNGAGAEAAIEISDELEPTSDVSAELKESEEFKALKAHVQSLEDSTHIPQRDNDAFTKCVLCLIIDIQLFL